MTNWNFMTPGGVNYIDYIETAANLTGGYQSWGSHYETIASLPYDTCGFLLHTSYYGKAESLYVRMTFGAASSEQEVDAPWSCHPGPNVVANNYQANMNSYLPLRLPKGTRVCFQGNSASGASADNYTSAIALPHYPGCESYTRFESAGFISGSGRGTRINYHATADTWSSWTELTASTSFDAKALQVCGGPHADSALTWGHARIQIAVGAASSEQVLTEGIPYGADSGGDVEGPQNHPWFPIHIPAGSRLSARVMFYASNSSNYRDVHINLAG